MTLPRLGARSTPMATQTEELISITASDLERDLTGSLTVPLVLTRYHTVDLGELDHIDSYENGTVSTISLSNIPSVHGRKQERLCLMWMGDSTSYQNGWGFAPDNANPWNNEDSHSNYLPTIAITQGGVYVHDLRKTYAPRKVHDYDRAYDFYPWSSEVPWGNLAEVWTIERTKTADVTEFHFDIKLTGSLHPGQEWTVPTIDVRNDVATDGGIGAFYTPPLGDFNEFPTNLTITAGSLTPIGATGDKPVIDTFVVQDPLVAPPNQSVGGYQLIVHPTSTQHAVGVGQTVTKHLFTETATPIPSPLSFTADLPIPEDIYIVNGASVATSADLHLWVMTDTFDVSNVASRTVNFLGPRMDYLTEEQIPEAPPGFGKAAAYAIGSALCLGVYKKNQAAVYNRVFDENDNLWYATQGRPRTEPSTVGGVLSFCSPYNDAITWTITGGAHQALFEIVNGNVLKFKEADKPTDYSVMEYVVQVTGEDEHSNVIPFYITILRHATYQEEA